MTLRGGVSYDWRRRDWCARLWQMDSEQRPYLQGIRWFKTWRDAVDWVFGRIDRRRQLVEKLAEEMA